MGRGSVSDQISATPPGRPREISPNRTGGQVWPHRHTVGLQGRTSPKRGVGVGVRNPDPSPRNWAVGVVVVVLVVAAVSRSYRMDSGSSCLP